MRAALIICLIACPVQCPLTGSRAHEIEAICVNWIYLSFHSKALYFAVRTTARANECRADQILCVDLISYSDAMKCQGMKHHLKYHPVSYKRWPLIKFSDFSFFFSVVSLALKDVLLVFLQAGQIKNLLKKIFRMVPISFLYVNPFLNDRFVNITFLSPMDRHNWWYWKFR